MVEIPDPFTGVVSFCASFLLSLAGNHGAVKINGNIIHADLVKKPVLKGRKNFRVPLLWKFTEKPAVAALGRHMFPTKYWLENFVISQPVFRSGIAFHTRIKHYTLKNIIKIEYPASVMPRISIGSEPVMGGLFRNWRVVGQLEYWAINGNYPVTFPLFDFRLSVNRSQQPVKFFKDGVAKFFSCQSESTLFRSKKCTSWKLLKTDIESLIGLGKN